MANSTTLSSSVRYSYIVPEWYKHARQLGEGVIELLEPELVKCELGMNLKFF